MQPSEPPPDPRKAQRSKPLPPPPLSPRGAAAAPKQEAAPAPPPAPAPAPAPAAAAPPPLRRRANTEDYLMMAGATKPQRDGHTFEQFLVVGIPHNADLSRVPARYEPQILYQWPTSTRIKTMQIEHFCFPNGVETGFVKRTPSCSSLNEVLHAPSHSHNSFIFLLTGENTFLYGVCVTRPEFLADHPSFFPLPQQPLPNAPQYVIAHRCYCLISRFPFFRLHFDVLHQLLAAERILRMEIPFFEPPTAHTTPPPDAHKPAPQSPAPAPFSSVAAASAAPAASPAPAPVVAEVCTPAAHPPPPAYPLPPVPATRKVTDPAAATPTPQTHSTPAAPASVAAPPANATDAAAPPSPAPPADANAAPLVEATPATPASPAPVPTGVSAALITSVEAPSPAAPSATAIATPQTPPPLAAAPAAPPAAPTPAAEAAAPTAPASEHPVVSILKSYHASPVPKQGESIVMQITDTVRLSGLQNISPFYCPPGDETAKLVGDWCLAGLFRTLSLENFLVLLCGLLQEKQIIFVSKNLTALSHAALSVIPIMRPFVWQGLFIPILPHSLADYLEAPVPFVVGIQRQPIGLRNDLLIVLLDQNKILTTAADRLPEAPKLLSNLRNDHRLLYRPNTPYNPYHTTQEQLNAVHGALTTLGNYLAWLLVRVMEHYGRYDLATANKEEIRAAFVNSISPANRGFIASFLNTQHFSQYLDMYHKRPAPPNSAIAPVSGDATPSGVLPPPAP